MPRIKTDPGTTQKPKIERASVEAFFQNRANRLHELGPLHAVIYQEKHGDLASRRDLAEKEVLFPLLDLTGNEVLLDVGCGTGRWVPVVQALVSRYVGVDFSPGFISFARQEYVSLEHCEFHVCSVVELAALQNSIGSVDRILCAGICIYLDDQDLIEMLRHLVLLSAKKCRIVFREPLALERRLTLIDHFSKDLDASYTAVYRELNELMDIMGSVLEPEGFKVLAKRRMYKDERLENRKETSQFVLVFEKC